ncbi:hypothetical protein D3C81_1898530 [compost metagenome]
MGQGLGDRSLPVCFVGHIQFDEQGMCTDHIGHGLAGLAVDVGNHHAGAFGGQQQGIGLANATGAAGDKHDLVFNAFHVGLLAGAGPGSSRATARGT